MQFLGTRGSLGVTEIARTSGVSKAAVHRTLTALCDAGLVTRLEGGRYRISPLLHEVGRSPSDDGLLVQAALGPLRQLVSVWNETAFVSSLNGLRRVALLQELSTENVRLTAVLGQRLPLTQGATGYAMLSRLGQVEREWAIEFAERDGSFDRAELEHKLDEAQTRGFASTSGSRQGTASAVAAPIIIGGGVIGAATVIGPASTVDGDRLNSIGQDLLRVAAEIGASIAKAEHTVRR